MIARVLMKYLDLKDLKIKGGNQEVTPALTGHYSGAIIDPAFQGASSSKVIRIIKAMPPELAILTMCSHSTEEQIATFTQ